MPINQIGDASTVVVVFLANKVGKTGLTVTVDVYEVVSDISWTKIVTDGAASEIASGLYAYTIATGLVDAKALYIVLFKTTDVTVTLKQIPTMWSIGNPWVENIDDAISDIPGLVWDETLVNHSTVGSIGLAVAQLLGITGQNVKWSSMSFDANHNMIGATITQYTDKTLVTPLRAWTVTASYDTDNELLSYDLKEV
ncbi:hypothetical protein LCGC14_0642010 [marine sediment metagenome]|uniref:Uncharacterized protein n=1 Tax=marine sediment metagenome TaxID=412755 RepID=A0A0F9R3Y2_9ZZZZ